MPWAKERRTKCHDNRKNFTTNPVHCGNKKLSCERCENVHACKCVRDILKETRAQAAQLANYNQALANDYAVAQNKVVALQAIVESGGAHPQVITHEVPLQTRQPLQNLQLHETERHTLLAQIAHLKQRLYGSETERGMQNAEIAQLGQRLHESENARQIGIRRTEELRQAHNVALRQTAAIRVAAQSAVKAASDKVQKLRHANASLNVQCGAYMQQQARLIASIASMTHQLNVARENAQVIRRMTNSISTLPPEQAVAAIHAARMEAREAQVRERSLAFAKNVLELANRAEHHRADYERAFREEATRSITAKAEEADVALNELQGEYRYVVAECEHLKKLLDQSENARHTAVRRAKELQHAHNIAIRQADTVRVVALARANQVERQRFGYERAFQEEASRTIMAKAEEADAALNDLRGEYRVLVAECDHLKQLLHESENARHMAIRRAEALQQAQNIAMRQVDTVRVAAQSTMNTEGHRVRKLQQTNAVLNTRCGAYIQERAHLIASIASVTQQLNMAREHARVMRRMAKTLSTQLPKHAMEVRAARVEAREAKIRERSLAIAKNALELANRGERYRAGYERGFREEATRLILAKAKGADVAMNDLRAEFRVVVAECDMLKRRFADAHDAAEEARLRARKLEQTNSSLAIQLRFAAEANLAERRRVSYDRVFREEATRSIMTRAKEADAALNKLRGDHWVVIGECDTLRRRLADAREDVEKTRKRARRLERTNSSLTTQLRVTTEANRAERHRVGREHVFRENETQSIVARATGTDAALNELRGEYRVVVAECDMLRRRFADAYDHAEEARLRTRRLERTNSSLATQLSITAEAKWAEHRRAEYERVFRDNAVRSIAAKAKEADFAVNQIRGEYRVVVSEVAQLKQLLHESENARYMLARRAEELQQAHSIALQQATAIRVATQSTVNEARHEVQKLRHANATLTMRCGAYMKQQAHLIATITTVTHQLDVAREHARAMRRMAKTLSTQLPKHAAAVRAARKEAREALIRERNLVFAKNMLEMANRTERHRADYERAHREDAIRSMTVKTNESDDALNELRAEHWGVIAECDTLKRRFSDAKDEVKESRSRARRLEQKNSSLASKLGVATEAAHSATVELAIAERSAVQLRTLAAKVARLRGRCGELSASSPNVTEINIADDNNDIGTVCVICLDVLGAGENVVRLNCMHVFHHDCITQCLSRMAVPSCPLDRIPVTVPLDQLPVSKWTQNSSSASEQLLTTPSEE